MPASAHRDSRVANPDPRPDIWPLAPSLQALLDDAQLLSLDIFDTLLLRAVAHPHDVFLEVGRRAVERGWLPRHWSPEHVRALRVNAAQRARAAKNPHGPVEVTLTEIWSAMPFIGGNPSRLVDLEIQVEAETCFRNPVIWTLAKSARARGIPVVLMSDMYLSRAGLERILAQSGCSLAQFDALFLSSEGHGAKWNGALYDRLAERYPEIAREHMLHVGDNVRSDVEQARHAGLKAFHYDLANPSVDALERLERMRHGASVSELRGIRRLASACAEESRDDLRWWFDLGAAVLGPYLSAFADWVVAECAADGITTIRPLMREGELLARMLDASARARQMPLDIQPLQVSRAASWLPGLEDLDRRAIDDLCSRPHLTVRLALELAGIDDVPGELLEHAAVQLCSAGSPQAEAAEAALRSYLSRADVRTLVLNRRTAARERFVRFISQSVGTSPRVAVVDLGFHGTTGRAIERATRGRAGTTWHQFLAIGAGSLDHSWFDGSDIRAFTGGPGAQAEIVSTLIQHAAVLEALLVTGASTVGYADAGFGHVIALGDDRPVLTDQADVIAACHRGILAFQRVWLDVRAGNPAPLAAIARDRRRLCALVHRLIDLPSPDEARRVGALVHTHNGGSEAYEPLADASSLPADADPDDVFEQVRTHGRLSGGAWLWSHAAVTQRWPGHLCSLWEQVRGEDAGTPALVRLARRARRRGIRTCLVYGAGEAGRSLAAALRDEGVTVRAFVDRNDRLWDSAVDGVPVQAPLRALAGDCHTYLVGSLAFAAQIHRDLQGLYARRLSDLVVIAASEDEEVPHAA